MSKVEEEVQEKDSQEKSNDGYIGRSWWGKESLESQEEEEVVANLCFMANIVSEEKETEVSDFELELSFETL